MGTKVLGSIEALKDLLEELNWSGRGPTVAFIDARGVVGVAYGIDEGDTMGYAYLTDFGEDRIIVDPNRGDPDSYIADWERDIETLKPPIDVLYRFGKDE